MAAEGAAGSGAVWTAEGAAVAEDRERPMAIIDLHGHIHGWTRGDADKHLIHGMWEEMKGQIDRQLMHHVDRHLNHPIRERLYWQLRGLPWQS